MNDKSSLCYIYTFGTFGRHSFLEVIYSVCTFFTWWPFEMLIILSVIWLIVPYFPHSFLVRCDLHNPVKNNIFERATASHAIRCWHSVSKKERVSLKLVFYIPAMPAIPLCCRRLSLDVVLITLLQIMWLEWQNRYGVCEFTV